MEFKAPPIAKLTADNGRAWLSAIRPYLMGAGYWDCIAIPEEGLQHRDKWLELIDGYSFSKLSLDLSSVPSVGAGPSSSNPADPIASQPTVTAAARVPLPDDREKLLREMKALGLMVSVIDDSLREWADRYLTPSDLYNAVRKQVIYSERFQARQYALELNSIKQVPTEPVHAYFSRGRQLASKLAFTGQGMSEHGVVENLLHGLLPAYAEERLAWSHPSKAESLNYWSVLEAVEFREHHMVHHTLTLNTKKPTASALSATGETEKRKGKGKVKGKGKASATTQDTCKFCNGPHDILSCLRLKQALALEAKPASSPTPAVAPRQPFAPRQQGAFAPRQQAAFAPRQHQQQPTSVTPRNQPPNQHQRINNHRNSAASAFVAAVGPLNEEERDEIVSEFMEQYQY